MNHTAENIASQFVCPEPVLRRRWFEPESEVLFEWVLLRNLIGEQDNEQENKQDCQPHPHGWIFTGVLPKPRRDPRFDFAHGYIARWCIEGCDVSHSVPWGQSRRIKYRRSYSR